MIEPGEQVDDDIYRIRRIVEKPGPEKTPSNFAIVCGYLLTPDVVPILAQEKAADDGEIRITDSVSVLARQDAVYGCFIKGDYHDTGNPELYLETIVNVALGDKVLGPKFRGFLTDRLRQSQ